MAINNDLFRYGGGRMIAAFILVWLVIAFVSWLGFQIWWNRREKVYAAATAHDDFVGGIRGLEELKKRVDSGEMKAAFALYPVSMQQLIDIADTGNIMPPKTTWFEPKLRSGVVIHTFEEK